MTALKCRHINNHADDGHHMSIALLIVYFKKHHFGYRLLNDNDRRGDMPASSRKSSPRHLATQMSGVSRH